MTLFFAPMRVAVLLSVVSCAALSAADQIPILSNTNGVGLLDGPNLLGDLGGLRSGFAEHGLLFEARLIADGSTHSRDGLIDGDRSFGRYLFEAGFTMDVATFVGLSGAGRLTATWQSVEGDNGSIQLGVLQRVSWLDGDGRDQIGRLFYVQPFFDEAFSIKVGKDEVTRDFASNPFGAEFLNDANRRPLAMFAMPTFPDSATMGSARLQLDTWFLSAGAYDGRSVTLGKETGSDWISIPESDVFMIAETGFSWDDRRRGHIGAIKAGVWKHSGTFATFDGGERSDVHGWYLQGDWMVMDEGNVRKPQGLGLWGMYSEADERITTYHRHMVIGAMWRGLLPERDRDAIGISHSWLETSRVAGSGTDADERVLELFYSFHPAQWLIIQPDLQWFVHPGGHDNASDVYAGSLRGMLIF